MKRIALSLAVAGGVFLTGCGGGGGGGGGSPDPGGNTPPPATRNDVSGPLDAVQGPLSSQVMAPLTQAAAGTPLAGVLNCVNQMVVEDMVDMIDRFALAMQPGAGSSAAAFQAAAANVQAEFGDLVSDMQGFVTSLAAAGGGCNVNAAPPSTSGNPLAGTPLASFGATLLPVLAQLQGPLNGTGGTPPRNLSPAELSALFTQLDSALDMAFASVPAEVKNAPMVGPSLLLVQQLVGDLQVVLSEAASADAPGVQAAMSTMLDRMLSTVLTGLVPLAQIENTSGDPGAVSGQIMSVIDQLVSTFSGGVRTQSAGTLGLSLTNAFDPLVNPFEGEILPLILGPITSAIGGGVPTQAGPTGTQLDGVLSVITNVLSGGAGGNPLQSLLGSLLGGVGGGAVGSTCPLAGTPLAALCGILGG